MTYTLSPIVLRLKINNQYLASIAEANGCWDQVKVVPCKPDDPHLIGWGLFPLSTHGIPGGFLCISDDRRVVEAALDSLQS